MGRNLSCALLAALLQAVIGCGGEDPPGERPAAESVEPATGGLGGESTAALPPEHLDRIVELFNRGVGLMDQYRPVEAAAAFEEVVRLAPGWTRGRLNLGIALLNGQSDESQARAEEELERVIAEAPAHPYAHYALGMLLRHQARLDEARARFERVLEIDPEDADAHYQLGVLLMSEDPVASRGHLQETLERMPHHESACYRLWTLLREAGEDERAREMLARFRALKSSGAGVAAGMKYGEMGRYADVLRAFDRADGEREASQPPVLRDVAEAAGLVHGAAAGGGWPGRPLTAGAPAGAEAFGPGVAVADVDGDGDLDLYIPGVGPQGRGRLYRNGDGRFSEIVGSGIDGRDAIGAYFGDHDGDGDPDLYLTCDGPDRLYANDGSGRFTDVTAASGTGGGARLSVGAAWADADHDGDLDLYVASFSAAAAGTVPAAPGATGRSAGAVGAPNVLWRNNGDGSFTDTAPVAGIDGGSTPTIGVVFLDVDDDRDLDLYLVDDRSPNQLLLNDRVGRYTDASSWFPTLADGGPGLGAVLGDVDLNGREDLVLLRGPEPPRLLLQVGRGRFADDPAFAAAVSGLGGAVGGLLGDLDLDGDLDVVLLGTAAGHRVLMNGGAGRLDAPVALGGVGEAPDAPGGTGEAPVARGAVAADLDGDGALELLIARAGAPPELWRGAAPAGRHWLEVVPVRVDEDEALWIDPTAVGLQVEVKTGRRLQAARVSSSTGYLGGLPRRLHFGLGEHGKADYVRLAWPDAVLQSELEIGADQPWQVRKVKRKPSSCPILFAWDGARFTFVTDFLGVGGLGFFVAPGEYAPPDPTEAVRIPPALIAPRGGRFLLRVAEPLEEVTYFDELHLLAYDHPADLEIHPDERFTGTPPFPTGRPFAVAEKILPVAARNERGEDLLDRIRAIDRRYAEPPADPRFAGYARDHWIELDFGERLQAIDRRARLVLYLYGWVEYTYSHVNYAAHQAGLTMRPPSVELPDGRGGWRVALPEAGFPAGLPRMMTLDVSELPIREHGRLRIRTNMEIFWDQIFVGEDVAGPKIRVHALELAVAQLRPLGYPREYSPDGADPTLYDYQRLDQGVPYKNLTGEYTGFGDVRALLRAVDDRFVVMARGDEIALEFDASGLPDLPAGWSRTLVLHADGYCKDMDLYTAFPETVEPLPYHAMEGYPPPVSRRDAGGEEEEEEEEEEGDVVRGGVGTRRFGTR